MDCDYHILDVFTDTPFAGNPLAVFPDARGLTAGQMQRIARELNLSETVFLLPAGSAAGTRRVRIFTPGREVPFAGHPTVGAAFFLVASGQVPLEGDEVTVVLEEAVGPIPVRVRGRGGVPVSAELTAAAPAHETPAPWDRATLGALVSLPGEAVGMPEGQAGVAGPWDPAFASAGLAFLVLPVRSRELAGRAALDSAVWRRLLPEGAESRMVYVVAPAGEEEDADFRVRMFGPDVGVPEDPATGSAAAALGAYLGSRLPDGLHRWRLRQGVEMGRPSRLALTVEVQGGAARVIRVAGAAVRIAQGSMRAPPGP
ncbi:MAG: PhzF family phenazine biosynthesis protein [Longimicrobiales bacterium]|nr:PhzF family phenazine biosynthesis protein [Longimicrobiales bacterium]